MRTKQALLVVGIGGIVGALAGVRVAACRTHLVERVVVVTSWLHLPGVSPEADRLEARLQQLEKRTHDLEALQKQLDDLEKQVNGSDGAKAYADAKRLGILDAVSRSRPDLRPSAVRRMGVAIVTEARKNDLDPLLLAALARVESGFNPFATSDVGARGLLQLTPWTGRSLATTGGVPLNASAELYDIETNISLGARYLADLLQQFDTVDQALLAYNRGATGARAVLKTPDAPRALAGYPHTVLVERARLAHRAKKLQATTTL